MMMTCEGNMWLVACCVKGMSRAKGRSFSFTCCSWSNAAVGLDVVDLVDVECDVMFALCSGPSHLHPAARQD